MTDYSDLVDPSVGTGSTPTPPEEEVFKSVYIRGQLGKNHTGVEEQPGKLQVRGHSYNHDKTHMIIMLIKKVLVNYKKENNQRRVKCFCYKPQNQEWVGISGKKCPETRQDRDADEFCNGCREEVIVAGIYCDADGTPIKELDEESQEKKPVFVFLRGRGIKSIDVNHYIQELVQHDFEDRIFDDEVLEKQVANRSRVVTEITVGSRSSSQGNHLVFNLQPGKTLPKETVKKILSIAKNYKEEFDKKFDWSRKLQNRNTSTQSTQQNTPDTDDNVADELGANFEPEGPSSSSGNTQSAESSQTNQSGDPFDDIPF